MVEQILFLDTIEVMKPISSHVKSKERVAQYGEVLTPPEIVNAMLDLVKQETERIDSRFLEPACGTGNFLTEILKRKLKIVEDRYKKNQLEYERYAVLAVSSMYGIDIQEDNVQECRYNLFSIVDASYTNLYKDKAKDAFRETVNYILLQNIVHGDALTLKTVGSNPQHIIFSEWSLVNGSMIKRRNFAFHELIPKDIPKESSLFDGTGKPQLISDRGEKVFIPEPVKEYPLVHFLEVAHAYQN